MHVDGKGNLEKCGLPSRKLCKNHWLQLCFWRGAGKFPGSWIPAPKVMPSCKNMYFCDFKKTTQPGATGQQQDSNGTVKTTVCGASKTHFRVISYTEKIKNVFPVDGTTTKHVKRSRRNWILSSKCHHAPTLINTMEFNAFLVPDLTIT